jgi:hypothetical protein
MCPLAYRTKVDVLNATQFKTSNLTAVTKMRSKSAASKTPCTPISLRGKKPICAAAKTA